MFTRTETKKMRTEIENALEIIAKKYGYATKVGNIKFGNVIEAKITVSKMASNSHGTYANTPEAQAFLERAERMGLAKDCLNEKYTFKGETLKITGYNSRAKKYPINYSKIDNQGNVIQRMKCSEYHLKDIIRANRPEFFL